MTVDKLLLPSKQNDVQKKINEIIDGLDTKYDASNPSGYISGITSTDITNALGYTPYSAANPNGYTSNVGTVTSVNNVTPVNGNVSITIPIVPTNISAFTNDSGYITSSSLNGYATETWVGQQGYITGITSSDVTTALGYTPYDATNPNNYISSVSWGDITGTLANQTDLQDALDGKQAVINSSNKLSADLVDDTSTTHKFATASQLSQISTNTSDISDINALIPSQATTINQLADKAFVNSSVQTATANFRGNWTDWADVPTVATDYPADYAGSKTPTVNDYLVVQDASDYTLDTLDGTWRFKYTGTWGTDGKSGWIPEYQVNETPLTAAQLAALDSGITDSDVALIGTALQPNDNITQLTNNAGYITGITSTDVNTALGYTAANDSLVAHLAGTETFTGVKAFNKDLYLTGITTAVSTSNKRLFFSNSDKSTIYSWLGATTNENFVFGDSTNSMFSIQRDYAGPTASATAMDLGRASYQFNNLYMKGDIVSGTGSSTKTYTLPITTGTLALTNEMKTINGNYLPTSGNLALTDIISAGSYISLTNSTSITNWNSAYLVAGFSDKNWRPLIWTGSKFVAISTKGYLTTSTDGKNWSIPILNSNLGNGGWWRIAYGNDVYVILGGSGYVSTSSDCETWATTVQNANLGSNNWHGLTFGNGKFVALSFTGHISTSTDGVTWTTASQVSNLGSRNWQTICYDGTKFIALGSSGYMSTSTDGTTWTASAQNSSIGNHTWYGLVHDGTKFVAMGGAGWVAESTDGSTWSNVQQIANLGSNSYYCISYGNGAYIAIGYYGYVSSTVVKTQIASTLDSAGISTLLGYTPVNPSSLATVATTGDYDDLTDKPTIPTTLSDLTVSAGSNITISGDTISATDTTYSAFTGADSITAGTSGLVPAPSAGDNTKFLKGDGTWATASGGTSTDVQINSTSITVGGVANIVTNTAYNASSNKIATMSDLPADEIFIAVYGTTTIEQISQALSHGKTPLCYKGDASNPSIDYFYYYSGHSEELSAYTFSRVYQNTTEVVYVSSITNQWNTITTTLEQTSNKVTSISSSSTDTQYASAKCTFDAIQTVKRNIGEIVQSTIPLSDAGLHLLDGALLSGSGTYADFVDYIADIYDASSNYFCSEADWQTSVATYGVCGKFVYDSINNTVRLPKIIGFIESASGVSSLGNLTEAGLPNITSTFHNATGYSFANFTNGAFSGAGVKNANWTAGSSAGNWGGASDQTLVFDASDSNSIYGNASTVQPQSIKVLYYIIIANTIKTEIQADIDNISTDLNGKADVDGSNMNASVKKFDGQWVALEQKISTSTAIGSYNIDISSYLPNDGYDYEIILNAECYNSNSTYSHVFLSTSKSTKQYVACVGTNARETCFVSLLTVGTNRQVTLQITTHDITWNDHDGRQGLYLVGYRRIGTNN